MYLHEFKHSVCVQVATELQAVVSHLIQVLGTEPGLLQELLTLLSTELSLQLQAHRFYRLLNLWQVTIKK